VVDARSNSLVITERPSRMNRIRPIIELQLEESTKRWAVDNVTKRDDGMTVIEYIIVPKKSTAPDELVSQLRASGGADPVEAEIL